ncbi:MAG: hypothetical protein ACI308_07015 [Muribaculaceae bacterium]
MLALSLALPASAQTQSECDDEEPIDLELVRRPVRRPGHAVITYITVSEDMVGRYAEAKPQKVVSSVAMSNAAAIEAMNRRARQSQAEVEANVEKYLAEARSKAPEHETYVPDFARRRIHDEEKMTQTQLLTSFNAKHTVGNTKYVPKSAPSRIEQNGIYLYFSVPTGSRPGVMNLRVQYYADDRLDTQAVEFLINGQKFCVTPDKLNTKREGRYVSEWFDVEMTGDNQLLLEAMGYANYVRVKFLGKSCNHIKDLTRDQVSTLRKAYFLHKNYR